MENLFVRLQNQEIETVVIPSKATPAQVFAVSLMRTAYFGLTNIIRSDDPTPYKDVPECILLDLGGGTYDTIANPKTRDDGTPVTVFGVIWEEMKQFYSEELQNTFESEFVIPTESGNLMSKYIEKIMTKNTGTSFVYALNAAYRVLKVWTVNG